MATTIQRGLVSSRRKGRQGSSTAGTALAGGLVIAARVSPLSRKAEDYISDSHSWGLGHIPTNIMPGGTDYTQ